MERVGEPSLVQKLSAHRGEVTCADAFGARLLTGGGDRALRLWRWSAGAGWLEEAVVNAAHRYGVTCARWSPGGALAASGGVDGALRAWSGRGLALRRTLAAPDAAAVRALCWPGGLRLLAGHDDGAVTVWHVGRAALLARLAAHDGALHALAAPAAGALLLSACTEGVLKVFDLVEVCGMGPDGAAPAPLAWVDGAHDLGAMCADANASGRLVATGGHDARIQVWCAELDAETGRWRLRRGAALEGHAATVTALRWAGGADARALLASAALDRSARLWDARAAACLHLLLAHPRYLTCVALDHSLRYMLTGSNDKTVRMWSLGALTIDDELEPACSTLAHFALGDLEGIGPVDEEELEEGSAGSEVEAEADENGSRRVWSERAAHAGPINCITVLGDLFATASSDGVVRVFRWAGGEARAQPLHALAAHAYPALGCDLGAGGALLLSAGLDAAACLWDVQTGYLLRSLAAPGAASGGEAGGGGVRGARLSPHRPPLVLLTTDDGLTALWSLADSDPNPLFVYGGHAAAAACCAWSGDGRALVTGGCGGELLLRAPPPAPATLHHEPRAHDDGVQSCDFAPDGSVPGLPEEGAYLLATAGADSLVKLWLVEIDETGGVGSMRETARVRAHGGGAASVRWGAAALLASAGGDCWARVWRAAPGGGRLTAYAAVPAGGAGGAPAVALLMPEGCGDAEGSGAAGALVAVGTMRGELALWRLPAAQHAPDDDADPPRFWDDAQVVRWLREYVTRAPGVNASLEVAVEVEERARAARLTGARLLDEPAPDLLRAVFGYDIDDDDEEEEEEEKEAEEAAARRALRARLADELRWLRREPPPPELAASAPHALLCPLSHRLLEEPARAADGFTYSRRALRERLAADAAAAAAAAASPLSGRPLRNRRLHPNHALAAQLRAFLADHDPAPDQ